MTENKRFDSIYYEKFCRVITDNGKEINPLEVVDLLNGQEETIQNQKGYILLLEQKLEENGIRLEPKDFD